ncbi:MAG: FUSC family protein [Candidatus Udaeobacter sp.]
MKLWAWKKENLPSLSHAFRTTVAATISILLGRLIGLPEAYWAAIATVVVMQSPVGDTVPLAVERIVASALGASVGAIESTYFGANLLVFALAMFLLGLISFMLRLEKVGYSYACITLVIIVLIPRADTAWIAAAHRFAEVSLGILVALAVVAVWREERQLFGDTTAQ